MLSLIDVIIIKQLAKQQLRQKIHLWCSTHVEETACRAAPILGVRLTIHLGRSSAPIHFVAAYCLERLSRAAIPSRHCWAWVGWVRCIASMTALRGSKWPSR